MDGKALTSDNALAPDNFRAHSPQTTGDSRPQPDTPGRKSQSHIAPVESTVVVCEAVTT